MVQCVCVCVCVFFFSTCIANPANSNVVAHYTLLWSLAAARHMAAMCPKLPRTSPRGGVRASTTPRRCASRGVSICECPPGCNLAKRAEFINLMVRSLVNLKPLAYKRIEFNLALATDRHFRSPSCAFPFLIRIPLAKTRVAAQQSSYFSAFASLLQPCVALLLFGVACPSRDRTPVLPKRQTQSLPPRHAPEALA